MYLGAKILEDISNGNSGQRYLTWVTRFYQQIIQGSTTVKLDSAKLGILLSSLRDVRNV